jgi:hypothetical protein
MLWLAKLSPTVRAMALRIMTNIESVYSMMDNPKLSVIST